MVMALGLFILSLSVMADHLQLSLSEAFGLRHWVVVGICVVLVGAGALLRLSMVMLLGVLMLVATLLADLLSLGDSAGFGLHQSLGVAVGVGLILIGAFAFRRNRTSQGPVTRDDEADFRT